MIKPLWEKGAVAKKPDGFAIELDGRPLRTPAKAPLVLPTRALAEMVAEEWRAQDGKPDPATMPATRTANAAIDKVTPQFDEVAKVIAAYGDSDLLCYRATAPAELVARQAEKWDPVLDWASETLGARLTPVSGVIHAPQDPAALSVLAVLVNDMTPFELAAFHDLVAISGSLVIGLAVSKHLLELEELWITACLDELWQEEQWGKDDEALAHRERKRQDFFGAAEFLSACEK